MPKIKIIEIYHGDLYCSSCEDEIDAHIATTDLSNDWTEVTSDELSFLEDNIDKLGQQLGLTTYSGKRLKLVVQNNVPIQQRIIDLKQKIKEAKEIEQKKTEVAKKNKEKREQKAAARTEAKKKKQLEQLKKELGVD